MAVVAADFEEDGVGDGPVIFKRRRREHDIERLEVSPMVATMRRRIFNGGIMGEGVLRRPVVSWW